MATSNNSERESLIPADELEQNPLEGSTNLTTSDVSIRTPTTTNAEHLSRQAPPGHIDLHCCFVRSLPFNICIAILTTILNTGLIVTLPIYSEFVVTAGSDLYIIILWVGLWTAIIFLTLNVGTVIVSKILHKENGKRWRSIIPELPWQLIVIIGSLGAFNGILSVYASDPSRTPGYLQALLSCTLIPFTIVLRYYFLRKGVSSIRLICCFMVLVGLFIASEPEIFDLDTTGSSKAVVHHSLAYRLLWPFCFAVAMVPVALANVLIEKSCKGQEVQSLSFVSFTTSCQALVGLFFFWTDLIKGFGLSKDIHEFSEHMQIGLQCHVGLREECQELTYIPWLFIGLFMSTNFCSLLLTRYAEGAVYTSIVASLATPMGALFWSVFSSNPFHYNPQFTVQTVYTLAGLTLMVPGTIMYNYYASKEEKEQKANALWRDIMSEDEIYRGE